MSHDHGIHTTRFELNPYLSRRQHFSPSSIPLQIDSAGFDAKRFTVNRGLICFPFLVGWRRSMSTVLQLVVGLGIFLYGMSQLESGARDLSGPRLRTWLLRSTRTPAASAVSGTLVTAILQSSSIVGLIVLAFASAGVIPFYNAVGVLLGANLGTTLTGWLVTIVGFKLDLNHLALPCIAAGGLSQVILLRQFRGRALGQILLGLGLVLFGLSLMKDSVADLPDLIPLSALQGRHALVYLLFGTLMAALIQSSSATMMLTLAALNSGIIDLPAAAAVVIGADLGTTSTVVLGSLTGNTIKKQLAFAHCFFNLVVDIAAFFVLLPLLPQLQDLFGLRDPLFSLVAFHSVFNLLGLAAFAPFLKHFANWIETIIKAPGGRLSLQKIPTAVAEAALPALTETVKDLWLKIILSNLSHFTIAPDNLDIDTNARQLLKRANAQDGNFRSNFLDNYEDIKQREGDIVQFALRLQEQPLSPEQTQTIIHAIDTSRAIVYSCKTLKDVAHNLRDLKSDNSHHARQQFKRQRNYHIDFYSQLIKLLLGKHPRDYLREEYQQLLSDNDLHHREMDQAIYAYASARSVDSEAGSGEISSQLNVNREVHHASKNILRGLQHWLAITVRPD